MLSFAHTNPKASPGSYENSLPFDPGYIQWYNKVTIKIIKQNDRHTSTLKLSCNVHLAASSAVIFLALAKYAEYKLVAVVNGTEVTG